MKLPDPIKHALTKFHTDGVNLKTASESDVYRFTTADRGAVRFLKIQESSWSPPLSNERDAMLWLKGKLAVPEVVAYQLVGETEYLITTAVLGMSSENEACHTDKQHLVELLAESLRAIHALPTEGCPLNQTQDAILDRGRRRIEAGIVTQEMIEDEGLERSPTDALDALFSRRPEQEGPVFTHGDYCLPNVIIEDSRVSGFIDLGYAGVGDPYRDFVAAQYSVYRNLGKEWVQPFFDAYGLSGLDEGKLRWYRQINAFA